MGTLAKAVHMMDMSTSPGAFPLQWDEIGWCWEMRPFPSRSVPAIHSKSEGRGSYYQAVAASWSLGILWLGEPHPSFLSIGPQLLSAAASHHGISLRGDALSKMNWSQLTKSWPAVEREEDNYILWFPLVKNNISLKTDFQPSALSKHDFQGRSADGSGVVRKRKIQSSYTLFYINKCETQSVKLCLFILWRKGLNIYWTHTIY